MRHHFSTNLGKARQPIGNRDEAIFIKLRDITGDVPTVTEYLSGQVRFTKVSEHHIGTLDEQQAALAARKFLERVRIDNFCDHARDRVSNGTGLIADLAAIRTLEIACINGDYG